MYVYFSKVLVCHPWLARGGRPCNLCEVCSWGLVSVDIVNSLLLFSLGFLSIKIHISEKWLWSYKLEVNRQRYLGRLSSLSALARPQSSSLIMFLAVRCARNGACVEQASHSCCLPCVKSCLVWSSFMDRIRNGSHSDMKKEAMGFATLFLILKRWSYKIF